MLEAGGGQADVAVGAPHLAKQLARQHGLRRGDVEGIDRPRVPPEEDRQAMPVGNVLRQPLPHGRLQGRRIEQADGGEPLPGTAGQLLNVDDAAIETRPAPLAGERRGQAPR